eukprot:TRINITY_DN62372_c0_g1_i1.p1 TRINITY_DN62372_c0_g1~~TRINITY_DN62372_c0_g1_i1.p1  ORF type:complete len:942 (+),score=175.77 TRINITY_DN62372_c0_g1_i1:89-2914(+)
MPPRKTVDEAAIEARKEFFVRVERIINKAGTKTKLLQDAINVCNEEYIKLFGRMHRPMLQMKDGKMPPRYLIDRDEIWVLYKPPLWQMGGAEVKWIKNVENLRQTKDTLSEAQKEVLQSDKIEVMQEWHGLTQGTWYIPDMDTDQRTRVKQWGFIQRLDVETDGPVIIAKTWRAQRVLQAQMKEHIFSKAYICLVHGRMENQVRFQQQTWSEMGADISTQMMLLYDADHDPFYHLTEMGKFPDRVSRVARTFYKPMAYYHRREDGTDYTLVYVNILTGITHQVRITLQSAGHPLVADDRYLPKEQAAKDLTWCPRNFLCEVRSDFFDVFGPHRDPKRKNYTRLSVENPLPRLFQNILENRLTLIEKLDATADLFQGPQYWCIGDEQLMVQFPKDIAFRQRVMRWGQRRGIHLDALDRLLLLDPKDINDILNCYKPPDDAEDSYWVCPECMGFNGPPKFLVDPKTGAEIDPDVCRGGAGIRCPGRRLVMDPESMPDGWVDWLADPTLHLLSIVNERWLRARKLVIEKDRRFDTHARTEPEGTPATEDVLLALEAALVLDAKKGGHGISELDLHAIPGLEDIKLPLGEPPETSAVRRCRLPGRGAHSQWTFTLKASMRLKHIERFVCRGKKLREPVPLGKPQKPPLKCLPSEEEKRRFEQAAEDEESMKRTEVSEAARRRREAEEAAALKKRVRQRWRKMKSAAGNVYYFDIETGDSQPFMPEGYEDGENAALVWERKASKEKEGEFYFYNKETGEKKTERPENVEIINDGPTRVTPKVSINSDDISWKCEESKTKPGCFYYFNSKTGQNEARPPVVSYPWKIMQSKSAKGQYFYFNEATNETTMDPPPSARSAPPKRPPGDSDAGPPAKKPVVATNGEKLPEGWEKKESSSNAGKFYYYHAKTNKTSWTKPSMWEKKESSSNPGKFYYVNCATGETSWTAKQ